MAIFFRLQLIVLSIKFVAGMSPYVDQQDKYIYGKPEPINSYDSNHYVSYAQ